MKREKLHLSLIILSLLSSPPVFAERAAYDDYADAHDTITGGVAIVPPATIERFVRRMIVEKLNADSNGSRLSFKTKAIQQQVQIPDDNVTLKEVMSALGVRKTLDTRISPIEVGFNLPKSGLTLKVQQPLPGTFNVVARWRITQLTARSPQINFHVPKGLFDRDFDIDSKPVKIALLPKSPAIQVELKLQVNLGEKGSKLKLVAFNTNINSSDPAQQPQLDFQIGPLTVDRQPLVLEIESNGRVLRAEEASIRAQLETLEPQFTATLRREIDERIQTHFDAMAAEFARTPPFKLKLDSNKLIEDKPDMSRAVSDLFRGINAEFIFSSLNYVQKLDLFTATIASHICFDGQCLFSADRSAIGNEDLRPLSKTQEIGMLVYESWLQHVVNSEPFQKRIRAYYEAQIKAPGVDIGSSGVKLHLNPRTKSVDIVFNLSIDIKDTALKKEANTPWKKFKERTKKRFGDAWEAAFGTGKRVIIPVEVHLMFAGYQKVRRDRETVTEMVFRSELPFRADGTVLNTYNYPSNIHLLTKMVRAEFMNSVVESFKEVIPPELRFEVPDHVPVQGMKLPLRKVLVSPNAGILFSAEVPEETAK